MAKAQAPNGKEKAIRVIVFREGDQYVAQCLEYDIATQARDLESLIDRLELTLDAEFAHCDEAGHEPHAAIAPAPNYYHDLWESRYASLERIKVPKPDGAPQFEVALAKYATHIFSYQFNGRDYTVDIVALDEGEAKERLKALAFARYDGELVARIPRELGMLTQTATTLRNSIAAIIRRFVV